MSLPDTVFIFALALIIFGPKKLPEIGRQIGKLVGEFRRASNEFKYQIEEELRQVDLMEKPSNRSTITASLASADAGEALQPPVLAEFPADPAASLPVGQYPNIDMLDMSELDAANGYLDDVGDSGAETAEEEAAAGPVIIPAEGSQARNEVPFAAVISATEDSVAPVQGGGESFEPVTENPVSLPGVPVPGHPEAAPVETEITHG
ncbi:MAG: twin-arginine translocase TatA/TatE family subunit [Acidobacteriaceae bacterium]